MEEISEIIHVPAQVQQEVFGEFDSHIKKLERQFQVAIVDRNGELTVSGRAPFVKKAGRVLRELTELSKRGNRIQEQNVDYAITMSMEENEEIKDLYEDYILDNIKSIYKEFIHDGTDYETWFKENFES